MDNYREKIIRIVERELKRTEEYRAVYRPELLGHVRKHYLLPLDVYGKKCEEPRLYLP